MTVSRRCTGIGYSGPNAIRAAFREVDTEYRRNQTHLQTYASRLCLAIVVVSSCSNIRESRGLSILQAAPEAFVRGYAIHTVSDASGGWEFFFHAAVGFPSCNSVHRVRIGFEKTLQGFSSRIQPSLQSFTRPLFA